MPERVPDDQFAQTIAGQPSTACSRAAARSAAGCSPTAGAGRSSTSRRSPGWAGAAQLPIPYQASKAAVINLTRNLGARWAEPRREGQRHRARVVPERDDRTVVRGGATSSTGSSRAPRWSASAIPGGRRRLLFFASDASSFVTGQTFAVDGGLSSTGAGGRMPQSVSDIFASIAPNDLGKRIVAGT